MIAILSDIHGNLPALKAVLMDAQLRGCKRIISLGDVVGYYAQPGECIDLLQKHEAINVLGNHDRYLVFNTNCLRSKLVAGIIDYHKKIISKTQLDWLRESIYLYREGTSLFVHGGPNDPQDQYLYSITEETIPQDVDHLFSGHTHVQAFIEFGQKVFCNPGSVGQPRDGDPRAAYAIMDHSNNISLHRIPYDIDNTVLMMNNAGFDALYYKNLYYGTQIGGRIDSIKVMTRNGK